jgi:predicted site-specific integrase-resolvase
VNLGEWARQQDIDPQTAHRWFRTGTLPVPARKMGKLILFGDLDAERVSSGLTAVYPRVSSAGRRHDLDRQVAQVCSWAVANGFSFDRPATEVGSGRNGERQKFLELVFDPKVTTVLVEHRDRSASFGSGLDDDHVRDMTEVLTSSNTRLDAA